jgi:AraC-like DNA-binding protein
MNAVKVKPPKHLKDLVSFFWYSDFKNPDNSAKTYRILADGLPGIIFQHSNGNSAVSNVNGVQLPITFLYGQNTSHCTNLITGEPFIFGVSLRPTAFKSLFGMDATMISNQLIDSQHFFSSDIEDILLNAKSPIHIIELFSKRFLNLKSRPENTGFFDKYLNHSVGGVRNLSANQISSDLGISRRQFQRKFKEHVGVDPETYYRILRFQKAIHLLLRGDFKKLSDVAYQLCYSDQSHFIRDFKYFSGLTPNRFLKNGLPNKHIALDKEDFFTPVRLLEC